MRVPGWSQQQIVSHSLIDPELEKKLSQIKLKLRRDVAATLSREQYSRVLRTEHGNPDDVWYHKGVFFAISNNCWDKKQRKNCTESGEYHTTSTNPRKKIKVEQYKSGIINRTKK